MALELFDFGKKRTFGEAFLVILMYSIIGMLLGGIVAGITQLPNANGTFEEGMAIGVRIGAYVAVFYISILSFLIVYKKAIYNNFWAIIVFLLSIIGSLLAGCIGAFIPLLILAMFENKKAL